MFTRRRPNTRLCALLSLTIVSAMTVAPLASNRSTLPKVEVARGTTGHETSPSVSTDPGTAQARAKVAYGQLDLSFEANHGQTDEQVHFLARGAGYTLFLTSAEAVFVLQNSDCGLRNQDNSRAATEFDKRRSENDPHSEICNLPSNVLRMRLEGATSHAGAQGLDQLPGSVNYFIGDDSTKWRSNIPAFRRVHYTGVYPGVDLVYYGNQQHLEYDFIVKPGADWQQVSLDFEGADAVEIETATGDLLLKAGAQTVRQRKPFVYQETGGTRREVESSYTLKAGGKVGFHVGAYDRAKPLVIDPVLLYSTYLGGSNFDVGRDIAVDSAGNAYVSGQTTSISFPTANAIQPANAGSIDAFVTKLNASGTAFIYSTYLGGSSGDFSFGIALDSAGNAYLTGEASSIDFPTVNPIQTNQVDSDAFVTKLNVSGTALIYSTYLGGGDVETGQSIAVDPAGNAYVTGQTISTNFPTVNPLQTNQPGQDAFVTKLNASGSAFIYSTYLGGSGPADSDIGFGIAADSAGNAYVTGQTSSDDFPTANAIQPAKAVAIDAFVTKLNTSGSALIYSTYLGGNNNETARAIAVDSAGSAYVTGRTTSTDFPTENPFQTDQVEIDSFVTKLSVSGTEFAYSTYLGGSDLDVGLGVAVDSAGNAYLSGLTNSTDFPPTAGPVQTDQPNTDAYVAKLNASGTALLYSTYLGGSGSDSCEGLAVDSTGNIYVAGQTNSTDFPTVNPIQSTFGGAGDAFVVRIGNYSIGGRVVDASSSGIAGVTVTLSGSDSALTTTDADGNFLFLGTTPHGEYNISSFKGGFTFTPSSSFIFDLDGNRNLIFIGSSSTPTATPSPTPTAASSATFQFGAASFATNEGGGKFQLIVTRSGDTSQAGSVDYATSDGTAHDRGDYTTSIGRLRFQPGDTAKSVDIFITDDVFVEGNETVQITLSNPSAGSQLGAMMTALLTVVDNDLALSAVNPIDVTVFLVRQHYVDFLNREPDAAGLSFWTNQITACGADVSCIERTRVNVSAAFFLSIEFRETGYLVHRLYRASFNRFPRYREFLRDAQEVGRGVVVGSGAWAAQLDANKQQFTQDLAARADFLAIYAGLTNEQFVDALNVNTGNSLSAAERNNLVAGLNGGTETRASALRKVAEDSDFAASEFTRAFVLAQYIGYLRRNPDDAPDTNFDGYNFWLNKLNSFGGDFQQAEMVKAFISSVEYRHRSGQP